MTEKVKKMDKQFVLSDSSVNEYGFRLLTSGYQLEEFQKNPIGYYMHRREEGIALKWEDVHIEEDKVVGTPVLNLSNYRGEQTCNEVENGFLNAASMGHIVVLEYSTEPEMMLPGQTGPTVTKWYNKECSLVDIPGNSNALIKLYDEQENEINLIDLSKRQFSVVNVLQPNTMKALTDVLQLTDTKDEQVLVTSVQNLVVKSVALEVENKNLLAEKQTLQLELETLQKSRRQNEISAILVRALEDRKITVELRDCLARDYADNPEGLKTLVGAMPAYRSIVEQLKARQTESLETNWQWDDFEKNDPAGNKLKDLRANDPVRYKELFDKKFGA